MAISPSKGLTPEHSRRRRTSPFAPLRHRTFRAIWTANVVSNLGGFIQSVGAAWLMTSLTGSAALVALVPASITLPIMLFSLAAGAIADNYDRRAVMLTAQSFMLVVSVSLAACTYLALITPWVLLAFTFLVGCGMTLNNPAWQSLVRDIVPREDLPQAITLNSVGMNSARSVGPALGGMIVAGAGAASAFFLNALSFVPVLVVLSRWRSKHQATLLPPEPLGSAMRAGLRFVAMSPSIKTVLGRALVFGIAGSSVQALMPLIARDLLNGGPLTFGLLLGGFGVGAVAGGLISSRIRQALSTEALVRWAFFGFAICALVCAFSPLIALTISGLAAAGAFWVLALSSLNVAVQISSPRWVVGRTLALYQTAAFGGMALGSWAWGMAADIFSVSQSLSFSALIHLFGLALGLRWRLPSDDQQDLEPLNRWRAPSLSIPVQHRSGPIVVTIEYRIRHEDVPVFLAVMAERRRVRRRDGARNWHLLRDLSEPELWTERYDTPTWLDYIRQAQRITQADARAVDRLRALHQGAEPPKVRRRLERQPVRTSPEVGDQMSGDYQQDPTQTPG